MPHMGSTPRRSITIRPMTVDDFAPVFKLGERSWNVQDVPYNYWSLSEVADHLQNHPDLSFVAAHGDRVVGFALGSDSYEMAEELGHLEWVAVDAGYRQQGIARQLVERLLEEYQKLGKPRVMADIASKNDVSRETFSRLGFVADLSVTFFVKDLDA